MGAHFGDNANSSNAVLRYANLNNEPSNANTNIGSSLLVKAKYNECFNICLGTGEQSPHPDHGDHTSRVKHVRRGNEYAGRLR